MKKITLSILAMASVLVSCESDPTVLNIDDKNPTVVNADFVYTSAEIYLLDIMSTPSVNRNNTRFFTQQITETQYTDEAKYNLVKRSMPDSYWSSLYTQLNKLALAKKGVITQNIDPIAKQNKLAVIEALTIYTYSILVDSYGDIPYSESLDVDNTPNPKYDDGLTIYKNLISRINITLPKISGTESFKNELIFTTPNHIKLFLNTLKLRLGLNLADTDATYAKTVVESAATSGVINSNSENIGLTFDKDGLFTSPIYQEFVASGRNDFVAANTLVNHMNGKNDPRRSKYFTLNPSNIYKGGTYGATNNYSLFSHVNDPLLIADSKQNLLEYSETEFMLAEAIERGYNVGGTADSHFANGISASMDQWGVIAADKTVYLLANNYSTLSGTWKQKIGHEAWIATYMRGFESWEFSRRLDFRVFVKPSSFDVPVRLPYPVKEGSVNNTHRTEAAISQWGSVNNDKQGSKIFWDKF
ncbi:hypothetical protein FPG87_10560 [Flavobacterium psychrophilum]|uniref:SusD/RagB family nutrient-binding outer membrane lipoprotein n=1 Tax=Flavobacterium psychrophilum TaxID=96345 RepID=UPI0009043AD2|nr:SusD/RagB family nutrient-binding outer membrane lipoprotein [Flavobacterium psychrophilum]OJH13963.1 hypothetical protein FPG87_10560 [Flavobacterium psychrophilum]